MIKTKLTGLLLQILCLLCCAGIDTEARNSAMQEIAGTGIAAGLETRCAMRDSQGFIWVGTTTGLNCYDGNGRTMYDAGSRLVRETSNMSVSALGECGDNILFGGNSGLYVFDRRANSICELPLRTRYKVSISSMIEKMIVTGRGKVWMGTEGQGVFMFDTADSLLVQNSRHGSYYSDLTEGSDGLIYAASLYGDIHAFDPAVELVYSVRIPGHRRDKNRISLAASGRYIWIASGENLYRLDTASRSVEPVATDRSTGLTNTMLARPDGSILIGSDNGLWRFNTITDSLYHFRYADEAGDNRDLRVTGLCGNTNNEVLILHPLGPIDVLSLNQPSVNFIPLTQTDGNRGSLNRIHTLLPGNDDKSFLAGADKGLYRIDITPEGFVTSHIAATGTQPVTTLMRYGDELWAGTGHNGIFVLDDKLQLKRNYLFDQKVPYSLVSNEINDIFRTRGGDIYVLTNWGICRYDKTNDYFLPLTEFSQHTRGTSMQQDRHGGLWIATNNGLRYRSPEGGIFEPAQHCRNIASSAVSELYVDSRGRLWAATKSHGMFLFDDELGDFRHIDIPMLDSKPVSFIAEDDSRQLWIGVNNMLANVRQGGEVHTYHFSHYPDITPTLNLTPLSRKGAIAIGDRDGFYTLEPARVKPYSNIVKVLPMQLSLPNKEDSRSELDRLGLDRPLYTMERIELPYNDNSLTIGFSAIRPATEPPVRFDYMLQGVDKAWITGAPAPEVTYNNLDVGTYTLLVRPHGIPDAKVSTLEIKILPPWYSSLWARMAYVVLAAMLGWLVFVLARRLMRRSLQRRIRDMRIQNEREVFEAKSRYFVDLVHEIRTPLMLISMPLEQLSEQESADDDCRRPTRGSGAGGDRHRYLSSMRRNIDYLLGITNQLLDFRKAENNSEIKLSLTDCDLSAMLRAIVARFDEPLKVSGKEISLTLPPDEVHAAIDADKTERLLMNLIGNAMKYARKDINVILIADNDNVTIDVSDDGPGVPVAERDKIFDTYYQIGNDNVAATLGTGLGLAYAKLIASAHHGDISVGEGESGGARFVLTLPKGNPESLSVTDAEAGDGYTDNSPMPQTDEADRQVKLLLAEDNDDLRRMISEILSRHYSVVTATDGVEALEKIASENPDIIVSDVMMPRMDGLELCRRVKADINTSHIPFIILTAKTGHEAMAEGMQCGADVYLEKPFPVRQLVLQVSNILRTRRLYYSKMKGTGIDEVRQSLDGTALPAGLNRIDAEFMEKMNRIIEESLLDDDFSIDRLAERLNLSRSSFYRKITALAGMPPNDYLKIFKLNYAARLLCEGYRVTEVTYRIGFTSSSYFAKCFKERFGMLPKEYVASQQSGLSAKNGQ